MAEIEALAKEPLKRKNFNFAEMIRDRTYPEIIVPVYVDEAKALRLVEITERETAIDMKVARQKGAKPTDEQVAEFGRLSDERDSLIEEMNRTRYLATVRGFSPSDRQKMLDAAFEEFPLEYEEFSNPITGTVTKKEIDNPKRFMHYSDLLWNTAIVRLVAADGAEAEPLTVEDSHALRLMLPDATRRAVDEAIEKVQMASDWYRGIADEVF